MNGRIPFSLVALAVSRWKKSARYCPEPVFVVLVVAAAGGVAAVD
jgi:hypothetical protein